MKLIDGTPIFVIDKGYEIENHKVEVVNGDVSGEPELIEVKVVKEIVKVKEPNFYFNGRVEHGLLLFQMKDCPTNLISEVVIERLGFTIFDLSLPYEVNYNGEMN